MTDLHQQIADLEAEIDALSDAAEQCRKSMVVAKVAIGVGILSVRGVSSGPDSGSMQSFSSSGSLPHWPG